MAFIQGQHLKPCKLDAMIKGTTQFSNPQALSSTSSLRVTKLFSFLGLVVYYMHVQHNLHMHPTILSSNIEGTISGLSFVPPVVSGTSMLKGSYQEQCYPNILMHIYQCYP